MAELQRLERSIATATELQSVVRTMKTLSAVGITQYEQAAEAIRAYMDTVERGLQVALRSGPAPVATGRRAAEQTALVAVGSDFGLCGTFNEAVADRARQAFEAGELGEGPVHVLVVGQRLDQHWEVSLASPEAVMELPSSLGQLGEAVNRILERLDNWQRDAGVTGITLLHQVPNVDAPSAPELVRIAPLTEEDLGRIAARSWPNRCLPMAHGRTETLFRPLVRQMIFARIYAAAALSRAAEYSARLAAMRAADRNIGDKLAALQSAYRLRRQEAITTELLDLVAGFEAAAPEL